MGALKHLAAFMKIISPVLRTEFVPFIIKSTKLPLEKAWRNIALVTDSLGEYAQLLSIEDVRDQLIPLFFKLSSVRQAEIRQSTSRGLGGFVRMFKDNSEVLEKMLRQVVEEYGKGKVFFLRQAFCLMCQSAMKTEPEIFRDYLLE